MPLTTAQRETLINTVLGEAANQGTAGMQAVAAVIRNRADSGQFPTDPAEVATQRNQFSANNPIGRGGNNVAATASPATRARAAAAVDAVFSGAVPDPTHGALYYHTGDVNPGWDNNMHQTAQIGAHTFYSPSPVPPNDVPAASSTADIGHLDALTNLTGLPYDPQPSVPLARVQPFAIPSFNPFTLGDQLAFDPVTTADTGNASAPTFNVTPNASVFSGVGMPSYSIDPGSAPDNRPATVEDRASTIRDLLDAMSMPNSSGSPDDRNVDLSQPIYTGQGIAGTAQLPAGYHPAPGLVPSLPDSPSAPYGGPFNELDAAASNPGSSSGSNDNSWAQLMQSFGSPTATANVSDVPYAAGSVNNAKDQSRLAAGQPLEFTTKTIYDPNYDVPKTITAQQLNPAYAAWLNNTADISKPGISVSGGATGAVGINGVASGSATIRKPAPPKYISVPIANPKYAPPKITVRIPAAAPVVAVAPPPTTTLIQQLQAAGLSPSQAYNTAGAKAMQQAASPNAAVAAVTGASNKPAGSIAAPSSGSVISPFHSFRRGGIVS